MSRPPRLLIVSPIASHPADQGNAARIQTLGAALMARGITCEFLCFATEGLIPSQQAAMAGFWHTLHVEAAVETGEASLPGCWGSTTGAHRSSQSALPACTVPGATTRCW